LPILSGTLFAAFHFVEQIRFAARCARPRAKRPWIRRNRIQTNK